MICVHDRDSMERATLIAAWSEVFEALPPEGLSRVFLRRFLATELQTQRRRGLPNRTKKGA